VQKSLCLVYVVSHQDYWNLSGGFLIHVLLCRFDFDSQTASANTNLNIDLVNHLRIAIMAKRKRAHDDLAPVTLTPSSRTLRSALAPSTSEELVSNIAAQPIIGRATTKQAPVEQAPIKSKPAPIEPAPIKSMPDMSIVTKDSVSMKVDRRSIPRTKEQREHTAIMRKLGKCAKCKLGPNNKQCLSSHHGGLCQERSRSTSGLDDQRGEGPHDAHAKAWEMYKVPARRTQQTVRPKPSRHCHNRASCC
jgi:hypothetical protein